MENEKNTPQPEDNGWLDQWLTENTAQEELGPDESAISGAGLSDISDMEIEKIIQETAADGCLVCPELTYEIIPDSLGIHVKPTNMKFVYQFAGPRRICIITDCTECNYDPAEYPKEHFRSTVDLNFNEAHELSGSRLTMDQAFRNFGKHTGASVEELFLMAATTPAQKIGIGHLTGSLVAGKWANIVILNEELQLQKVIFQGEVLEA
jgi:N-acetylglucosamine-6-phosphate deacetylase